MRALVVDDSTVMRKIMIMALHEASIDQVDEAQDGCQALISIVNQDYDLVLMDWNMPNMKGIDAVRQIRAQGKSMPIIMVTSESDRAHVIEAIREGVTNYIVKPFDRPLLIDKVRQALRRTSTVQLKKDAIRPPSTPPSPPPA